MSTGESFEEFLKLARSTAECDEGPEVHMRPGLLTVRYDSEGESGKIWTTLLFPGALALRMTPEPAVSALVARAHGNVGLINYSTWIASLRASSVDGRLPADLKHFVVFFDHRAGIETIARSCELCE